VPLPYCMHAAQVRGEIKGFCPHIMRDEGRCLLCTLWFSTLCPTKGKENGNRFVSKC
jgi:hypothetical protein